jgi:acetyl esterase/lipase
MMLCYGALPEQCIELTAGRGHAAKRPLVVLVHGGFWKPRYDRSHMNELAAALVAAGWSVANIEYRRIGGEPDATLDDVRAALSAVTGAGVPHDGRLILVGFSAGGHLALWAAATLRTLPLAGALGLAPVADLRRAQELRLGDDAVALFMGKQLSRRDSIDPARLAAAPCAVTLLHGDADTSVPMVVSESYLAAHPSARLVPLPAAGHMGMVDPAGLVWPVLNAELEGFAGAADQRPR